MASIVTTPTSINTSGTNSGIGQINADGATPLAPIRLPAQNYTSMVVPPKGPDGKSLILNPDGTAWVPSSNRATYSDNEINGATKNGTDTSAVLHNGLEATIGNLSPDSLASLSSPQNLNSQVGVDNGGVSNTFTANTKLIGQQLWTYNMVLFNHKQRYVVPARAIKVLCIEDDLLSWPLRGYVIVENRLESFERSEDYNSFYYLRSDARDEILLEVYPVVTKGTLPDRIWKIDFEGIVYDVEDLQHPDMTVKAKKLYFWDKKFQNLLEKNIQWSTATGKRYTSYTGNPSCPLPIAHASDMERSMYTGEAIASILAAAGYEQYIDFSKWNWGKSKIQFAAKANWTVWECVQYILQQQISNDGKNDICLLQWDRGDKKWNLNPVWRLFEAAGSSVPGELQVEHMFFEDAIAMSTPSVAPPKAPISNEVSYENDIKASDYNKIANYRFSQTSGLDNAKAFLTRPIYSHWHKNKQFDVDVEENEISTVREQYFQRNYVDYVLSRGNYPMMVMNKTKENQKSIDPQFSPISTMDPSNDRHVRSLDGRGKILYAGLFLNQSLVIRMNGSTHRLSGTFIGVDRLGTSSDTIYDYQLCGQYLVSNVKHILQQQKYVNDITMVKVHAYDKMPVNEGIE